jgi:membrane-bound serine protease (ClpP class)
MQRRTARDPREQLPTAAGGRPDGTRRRTPGIIRIVLGASALFAAIVLVAAPASAGEEPDSDPGFLTVVEVSGLLDPVLVEFVEDQIADAERDDAVAVVLQLNSGGAVVSDERLAELTAAMERSKVPMVVWVGPSGSRAAEGALELLGAADVVAVAPGAHLRLHDGSRRSSGRAVEDGIAELGGERAATIVITTGELRTLGIPVETRIVGKGAARHREPVTQVRFVQLPLTGQLLHTVASPAVAYLLFVIGLALLVFELYTAGVGMAGVVGAGCVLLGSYGLGTLPTRPVAVALLLLAMFGYAVDVQTGTPRVWTAIATVALVAGSLLIYDGLSVSWITLVVTVVGMTLAMIAGMPAMIRSRFSTPTIGREWMVGEHGEAVADVAPDGVVTVRDAPWRARTNRATPIRRGETVRVVAIDGLVLEVEPEEGGARDYRERARSH